MSPQVISYNVDLEEAKRIDLFLAERLPDYTRSRIQALIRDGAVLINEIQAMKTGVKVEKNDLVEITLPDLISSELIPEKIDLDVLFENGDLAIINKPAGMVVHPAAGHDSGTLVHAALARFTDLQGISGEIRPGIVHRLDKDTSGIIVIAKNEKAHRWLQEQFKSRKVEKIYIALVDGMPPTLTGRVEAAIARDPSHR